MATDRMVIPGVVKNGLIVPQGHAPLPEGAQVEIVIPALEPQPDLRAEFDAWERAGDGAWALIDQWNRRSRDCRAGCAGLDRLGSRPSHSAIPS